MSVGPVKAVLFSTMVLSWKDTGRRPRSSWIELCLKSKCESTEYTETSFIEDGVGISANILGGTPASSIYRPKVL